MYIGRKKKILLRSSAAAVLALAVISSTQLPRADDLSSLKSRYAALQQQQQQLQQQLSGQKSQYNQQSQLQAALAQSVQVTRDQIAVLNAQVSALDAQIAQKESSIEATQKRIDANYALFKQRLCAMYKSGTDSYVDVLLSSDNLTGFFMRFDTLKYISQHDRDLISSLQQDTEQLKKDKAQLESDKTGLENSRGAVAAKQQVLNAQLAQQTQVVQSLKSNLDATRSQANSIQQQAAATDAQINAAIAAQAAARRRQLQQSSGGSNGGSIGGSGSGSVSAQQLVGYAEGLQGVRYVTNGASPSGFDCSGFTAYVYANAAGIYLPHSASGQAGYGSAVSRDSLQPGDLVFFNTGGGGINHVGIYVGGGSFIAANTGSAYCVSIQSINSSYWASRYVAARRLL